MKTYDSSAAFPAEAERRRRSWSAPRTSGPRRCRRPRRAGAQAQPTGLYVRAPARGSTSARQGRWPGSPSPRRPAGRRRRRTAWPRSATTSSRPPSARWRRGRRRHGGAATTKDSATGWRARCRWCSRSCSGVAFGLLLLTFRSLVVGPAKAMVLNVLSVVAAFGLLTLVFQTAVGRGARLRTQRRSSVLAAVVPVRDPVRPAPWTIRCSSSAGSREGVDQRE